MVLVQQAVLHLIVPAAAAIIAAVDAATAIVTVAATVDAATAIVTVTAAVDADTSIVTVAAAATVVFYFVYAGMP